VALHALIQHLGPPINLPESLVDLPEPAVDLVEPPIHVDSHLAELPVHVGLRLAELPVHVGSHLAEPLVHVGSRLAELPIHVGSHLAELLAHVGPQFADDGPETGPQLADRASQIGDCVHLGFQRADSFFHGWHREPRPRAPAARSYHRPSMRRTRVDPSEISDPAPQRCRFCHDWQRSPRQFLRIAERRTTDTEPNVNTNREGRR